MKVRLLEDGKVYEAKRLKDLGDADLSPGARKFFNGDDIFMWYDASERWAYMCDDEVEVICEGRFEELLEAAAPLQKFLKDHYNPMCKVEVESGRVTVYRADLGVGVDLAKEDK